MRSELHRLVRDLKTYVEWQRRGLTAPGAPPATPEDRAAFDERQAKRRTKKIAEMSASLRAENNTPATPPPARPAPTLTPVPRHPAPTETSGPPTAMPSRDTPRSLEPKPKAPPATTEDKLWLKLGSKPKPTFGATFGDTPPPAPRPELSNAQKLQHIRETLGDCQRCGLCQNRTQIVFGAGNANARLMFIGEAPGAHEDQQGQPFVGDSGELLNKMIVAMGFQREDVYLANVLKCRPPQNRDPQNDEIQKCAPFLLQQIDALQPEVIIALGRFAADTLLRDQNVKPKPGQWQALNGIPVMPTFHPAYLLENPQHKRDAWAHLQAVIARLNK